MRFSPRAAARWVLDADGRAGAARAQGDDALRLAHAAPHAIRLTGSQGVLAAQLDDRAGVADGLGAVLALGAGPSALAVRVVEHVRVFSTACALELPIPKVRIWPREQERLRHVRFSFVEDRAP